MPDDGRGWVYARPEIDLSDEAFEEACGKRDRWLRDGYPVTPEEAVAVARVLLSRAA